MHIVTGLCAIAVPLLLFLEPISDLDLTGWEAYERTDVLVLIFCVLALLLTAASLVSATRALVTAAAGLLFATFGLLIPGPFEQAAQSDGGVGIGAYLSIIAALIGAGAAVFAAEQAPDAAPAEPIGAGRGVGAAAGPVLGGGLGGGGKAPPPQGQQPQVPVGGGVQAGWYDDPHRQARLRYFDGRDWTEQTSS